VILAVGGIALAITAGNINLGRGEQTLSLLYSFVSGNRSILCPAGVLVALIELYLTSINFN